MDSGRSKEACINGDPDPTCEGAILRTKSSRPWTCLAYDILCRWGGTHIMQMSIGAGVLGHVDHGRLIIVNVLVLSNNGKIKISVRPIMSMFIRMKCR